MSKPSEQYRIDLLQRLKARYGEETDATQAANRNPREIAAEQSARQVMARLEAGLPKADLCPYCWYLKALEVPLEQIPCDRPGYIRLRCPTCGYSEDREVEA